MCRPLYPVQHVQVVGHYPGIEQRIAEIGQGLRVIIHPAQQHALVKQRDARLTQHGHRRAKLAVNFISVVDVVNQDHLQRRTVEAAGQHLGDARRDHDRQAAVNTQTLNVRNGFQLGH